MYENACLPQNKIIQIHTVHLVLKPFHKNNYHNSLARDSAKTTDADKNFLSILF